MKLLIQHVNMLMDWGANLDLVYHSRFFDFFPHQNYFMLPLQILPPTAQFFLFLSLLNLALIHALASIFDYREKKNEWMNKEGGGRMWESKVVEKCRVKKKRRRSTKKHKNKLSVKTKPKKRKKFADRQWEEAKKKQARRKKESDEWVC